MTPPETWPLSAHTVTVFADIWSVGMLTPAESADAGSARRKVVKTSATIEPAGAVNGPLTQPAPERRKMPRFLCEGTGEVIVLGGALRFTGEVQDLSASGCRLETEVVFALERGTHVEVLMVVNRMHFRVAAGVRSNHRKRGVGLEFMSVSARCARLIQELISELKTKAERERRD